jgi:triphosphatase
VDRQAASLATPLDDFASHALTRRLARVNEAGDDLSALPADELHRVRIQVKRLRYAAEFFAPLYSPRDARRFIRRTAALQERLGLLNDGAVAQHLMAQLGGGDRGFAAGVVRGFVAAGLRGARAKAERSWRKFRRLEAFWR